MIFVDTAYTSQAWPQCIQPRWVHQKINANNCWCRKLQIHRWKKTCTTKHTDINAEWFLQRKSLQTNERHRETDLTWSTQEKQQQILQRQTRQQHHRVTATILTRLSSRRHGYHGSSSHVNVICGTRRCGHAHHAIDHHNHHWNTKHQRKQERISPPKTSQWMHIDMEETQYRSTCCF